MAVKNIADCGTTKGGGARMSRRMLSTALSVVLTVGLMPSVALASEGDADQAEATAQEGALVALDAGDALVALDDEATPTAISYINCVSYQYTYEEGSPIAYSVDSGYARLTMSDSTSKNAYFATTDAHEADPNVSFALGEVGATDASELTIVNSDYVLEQSDNGKALYVTYACDDGTVLFKQVGSSTSALSVAPALERDEDGTILIGTAEDLATFGSASKDTYRTGFDYDSSNVKITADISMDGWAYKAIGTNTTGYRYCGTFDGQGHTIDFTGATMTGASLIAYLSGEGAMVKNVIVTGEISGSGSALGAVVGAMTSGAIVENCTNKANVTNTSASGNVGGIVGSVGASCIVRNCTNEGTITDANTGTSAGAGGIAGNLTGSGAVVENCINKGTVTVNTGTTNKSYGGCFGGIVGYGNCTPTIRGCANTGDVIGYLVGGVIGRIEYSVVATDHFSISDCYNTGNVTGTCVSSGQSASGAAGGILGYANVRNTVSCPITNCYNAGIVKGGTNSSGVEKGLKGGLIGYANYNSVTDITNCYWIDSSVTAAVGWAYSSTSTTISNAVVNMTNCSVKTAAELKAASVATTLNADRTPAVWTADEEGEAAINGGYPILAWQGAAPATKTDIADCTIAAIPDQTYTGEAIEPALTITAPDGTALVEGTDFTVAYADNVATGTATATVTGCGDSYEGTATASFEIVCAFTRGDINNNGRINVVDAQIVLDMANAKYGTGYATLLEKLAAAGTVWDSATAAACADFNRDDVVNAADARAIQFSLLS